MPAAAFVLVLACPAMAVQVATAGTISPGLAASCCDDQAKKMTLATREMEDQAWETA